jgi:O-antigen ligase
MSTVSRDNILTASFLIWCALITYPLMTVDGSFGVENRMILYQMFGFLQYAVIAVTLHAHRIFYLMPRYDHLQHLILLLVLMSVGLQLHGQEISVLVGIGYTVALMSAIVLLSLILTMEDEAIRRCMAGAALLFLGFALLAIALFGWPKDRYIGEIHPNFIGSILLSSFIFSQFCKSRAMHLVKAACAILTAVVSSRFALIGCVLTFVVFELLFKPSGLKVVILAGLAALCLVAFPQPVADVLALHDPARGVSSGLTGRDDEWRSAFDSISNNPFGVGFKRALADEEGHSIGHNGYLKMFLEFGVLGGSLINLAVVGIVLHALFKAFVSFRDDMNQGRFACARAAGLTALAFASFFQPQIFNLGDVHGITFMLLLFVPGALVHDRFSRPVQLYRLAIGR